VDDMCLVCGDEYLTTERERMNGMCTECELAEDTNETMGDDELVAMFDMKGMYNED
jgi:hypothetical protein